MMTNTFSVANKFTELYIEYMLLFTSSNKNPFITISFFVCHNDLCIPLIKKSVILSEVEQNGSSFFTT